MTDQERRNSSGRRTGRDRRKRKPGIIDFYSDYDGPDRRNGAERRMGMERRQ